MKIRLSTIRNFTVGILIFTLGGVVGYRYARNPSSSLKISSNSNQSSLSRLIGEPSLKNEKVNFDTFWEVWGYLERDYLDQDKLDTTNMVNGAIGGMTASLGDPYTVYLPPKDNQRSGEDLAGSFYGVGIELGYVDSTLAVIAPLEGTPADEAGVQAGDLILHVRDEKKDLDEDTTSWSLNTAVENIRGKKNTEVILTLFREDHNNNQPFEVVIKRGEIVVESVKLEFIEHDGKRAAHLRISRFGERTNGEWNKIVRDILAQQNSIDGVILDMRNNPGGFFDTSIDIASDFVKKGIVVSQQGKVSSKDYQSKGTARLAQLPLVVLVNRGSASASEIVAGALRDNLKAKLVGEKTFGKGTVQDRREVSNGGGIHITVGRWIMPKGDWIHEEGIPVDVEVKQDYETEEDEVLQRGIEELGS